MYLLFLDFDGVLNSQQSTKMHWRKNGKKTIFVNEDCFCPISCSNLLHIVEQVPELRIVVSSSWRLMHDLSELKSILKNTCGIEEHLILGTTPRLRRPDGRSSQRGEEIQAWLDTNTKVPEGSPLLPLWSVQDFVIVDDDSDMAHLRDTNFLQTDYMLGLTLHDANRIIKRFKGDAGGWE